jgi:hypothetical protein
MALAAAPFPCAAALSCPGSACQPHWHLPSSILKCAARSSSAATGSAFQRSGLIPVSSAAREIGRLANTVNHTTG